MEEQLPIENPAGRKLVLRARKELLPENITRGWKLKAVNHWHKLKDMKALNCYINDSHGKMTGVLCGKDVRLRCSDCHAYSEVPIIVYMVYNTYCKRQNS